MVGAVRSIGTSNSNAPGDRSYSPTVPDLVRGPQVAGRYRLDAGPGESVADDAGWFHTGDLGHVDSDGFLFVTGRMMSKPSAI